MSQPREHAALEAFFLWESQSWVEAVADLTTEEKAYFMPLEDVKNYWAANDCYNLNNILTELFQPHYPPIDPESILCEHAAIFCTLLRVGQGVLIEYFVRYDELSDQRLPFDPDHPPRGFPIAEDDPTFLRNFCAKQWTYCVPVFDDHMLHKHFGRQRILPIVYKEPRGIEGMAGKYMIKLFGPYNEMLSVGRRISIGSPYIDTFTLKRYPTKQGEGPYKQEVNGFRSVKHVDSIINCYGSYIHGDEFNILLEFADKGTLEEYFQTESPPSRGTDIIKFWENMFQLIKGLKAIHSVREAHHDVRPETVAVVSHGAELPSEWQFKFADFGLNNTREISADDDEARDVTYTAPELCFPSDSGTPTQDLSNAPWEADIWSLGCIFSEAAVWIADGYKGVQEFRRQRILDTERITFKSSDGFHDGQRVLHSVLDSHRDIEDRLRRSDYITKDVLDSMVDEMLWEEDRPKANALLRKADMISSRARNKLSGDQFPSPRSSQSRGPPPHPSPSIPLPLIPRSLRSISERQFAPGFDRWQSQRTDSHATSRSGSEMAGPTSYRHQVASTVGSGSNLDKDLDGSIESWQVADNLSTSSPTTPFDSPPGSMYIDSKDHALNRGRPRMCRSQSIRSSTFRTPPKFSAHAQSVTSHSNALPTPPDTATSWFHQEPYLREEQTFQEPETLGRSSVVGDIRETDDNALAGRAVSITSRHSSGGYSTSTRQSLQADFQPSPLRPEDLVVPARSQKRPGGFSLFPATTHEVAPVTARSEHQASENNLAGPEHFDAAAHIPRSIPALPSDASVLSLPPEPSSIEDFLSVNVCLEWKMAHKKVKKHSKVPPLPGSNLLESTKDRDHAFIIDDSNSMVTVWPDVKRVFEALSYVVKGMSPEGTELFYTISYDTYRRRDTSDLVKHLETKTTAGETDMSHRLTFQLQAYQAKMFAAKGAKGKKAVVRPMSIYVLTNGEWGSGADPKTGIKEMADFLVAKKMAADTVTIQFISFAQSGAASQKIDDVVTGDHGLMVDSQPWKGNVLKMLLGPLSKTTPGSSNMGTTSRPASSVATMRSVPAGGAPMISELA